MIGLLACGKQKMDRPARAEDLYTSGLFRLGKAYLQSRCAEWAILSTAHGLLMPDKVVSPYEQTLKTMTAEARRAWHQSVNTQIRQRWPDGQFLVVLGAMYRGAVAGLDYRIPWGDTPNMGFGKQMAFFKEHTK